MKILLMTLLLGVIASFPNLRCLRVRETLNRQL